MNEFLTYEYVVAPPKRKKLRALLLLAYALYAIIPLIIFSTVGLLFLPLYAVIPLTLWIVVLLTWPATAPEYEYSMTSGDLTFSVIYGGRRRKKIFETKIKAMEDIAPNSKMYNHKVEDYRATKIYDGASSREADGAYFALFENAAGERCVYYFEPTEKALKILRHYNPKTVVTKVKF